jgi:hypothetical protein
MVHVGASKYWYRNSLLSDVSAACLHTVVPSKDLQLFIAAIQPL